MNRTVLCSLLGAAMVIMAANVASADYLQDFSGGASDWNSYTSSLTWNADETLTIGGPSSTASNTGAYTTFDGYQGAFGGGFTTSIDIYLDTNWLVGEGFDYTVGWAQSDTSYGQDFMFHVGMTGDEGLLVNASNNTDNAFNEWKLDNENGGLNYLVTASGWYTFEQVFRTDASNASGYAVDFNLYDASGLVYTVARDLNDTYYPLGVGGHRHGWFTYQGVDSGLIIDNVEVLYGTGEPVPEPASLALLGLGLGGLVLRRRRKKA